jgi:hypothetical protein
LIVSTTNFGVPIDTIAKNFKRQCLIKIIDEKIEISGAEAGYKIWKVDLIYGYPGGAIMFTTNYIN